MTQTTRHATYAYVGFNDKGIARAICIDDADSKKDTAALVAEWIRMGRTVRRMPVETAWKEMKEAP